MKKEYKTYEHAHIVLCSECGGKGAVNQYAPGDIFHSGDCEEVTCRHCNGYGRVTRSGVTVITETSLNETNITECSKAT